MGSDCWLSNCCFSSWYLYPNTPVALRRKTMIVINNQGVFFLGDGWDGAWVVDGGLFNCEVEAVGVGCWFD